MRCEGFGPKLLLEFCALRTHRLPAPIPIHEDIGPALPPLRNCESVRMVESNVLSFIQFLEDLSKDSVILSPAEVERMRSRFGDKVLQMGRLDEDGSMSISVESIVEAVHSLGGRKLNEAVENLKSEDMVSMLESAETLVERVAEVERRKLAGMVERFQSERDDVKAHRQWKEIEKMVFGVDYQD